MATQGPLLFCALVLVLSFAHCHGVKPSAMFSRHSFPPGFTFGAASSAYQVQPQHFPLTYGYKVFSIYALTCILLSQYEGAAHLRGKSIWDTFTAKYPGPLFSLNPGSSSVWPNLGKERTTIMINDNFSDS